MTTTVCPRCGAEYTGRRCPDCEASRAETEGDATGGVIPYKNPPALIAYYLGLFSLAPVIGLFLAVPALVLGIIGLKRRRENPAIKGSVHAWIGIGCGSVMTLVWGMVIFAMIAALIAGQGR